MYKFDIVYRNETHILFTSDPDNVARVWRFRRMWINTIRKHPELNHLLTVAWSNMDKYHNRNISQSIVCGTYNTLIAGGTITRYIDR